MIYSAQSDEPVMSLWAISEDSYNPDLNYCQSSSFLKSMSSTNVRKKSILAVITDNMDVMFLLSLEFELYISYEND